MHRRSIFRSVGFCVKLLFVLLVLLSQSLDLVMSLHVVLLTGTTRVTGPPRPILGPRVVTMIQKHLQGRSEVHQVSVVHPQDVPPSLDKPHFAYAPSQVPSNLAKVHETLSSADAFITITPEYNHAPSPGLLNILNHFGSSTFAFKPSAIVSYSAGQWGGTRAATLLRPILSELGCLPVSAMIHIPRAGEVLDAEGCFDNQENSDWDTYVDRTLAQLAWWAAAARQQRKHEDPFAQSPAFVKNPSERNAPV